MVVYIVQKVSEKSGWKVNGTQLFWVVPVENFWEQKKSEEVVLFFPDEVFQTEIHVPFLQSHL